VKRDKYIIFYTALYHLFMSIGCFRDVFFCVFCFVMCARNSIYTHTRKRDNGRTTAHVKSTPGRCIIILLYFISLGIFIYIGNELCTARAVCKLLYLYIVYTGGQCVQYNNVSRSVLLYCTALFGSQRQTI